MEKNPYARINILLFGACVELILSWEMLGLVLRSQIFCYGVFCVVEMSIHDDVAPPYFSAVTDGCAVHISVISAEEGFNSGG